MCFTDISTLHLKYEKDGNCWFLGLLYGLNSPMSKRMQFCVYFVLVQKHQLSTLQWNLSLSYPPPPISLTPSSLLIGSASSWLPRGVCYTELVHSSLGDLWERRSLPEGMSSFLFIRTRSLLVSKIDSSHFPRNNRCEIYGSFTLGLLELEGTTKVLGCQLEEKT